MVLAFRQGTKVGGSSKVWIAEREKIIRFIQMYSNKQRDRIIDCLPEARKKHLWWPSWVSSNAFFPEHLSILSIMYLFLVLEFPVQVWSDWHNSSWVYGFMTTIIMLLDMVKIHSFSNSSMIVETFCIIP